MTPPRLTSRRDHADGLDVHINNDHDVDLDILFIDPMLGSSLQVYIDKDVSGWEDLAAALVKYGGSLSAGYSGVPYILVDPLLPSGQNLYRQYAGKKGKIVLDARWIHECIKARELQTFHHNWAGCKVDGNELAPGPAPMDPMTVVDANASSIQSKPENGSMHIDPGLVNVTQPATVNPQQTLQQANIHPVQAIIPQAHTQYFPMYHSSRPMDASVPASDPPHHHQWQQDENHGIAPQQTHIIHSVQTVHPHAERNTVPYREDTWDGYNHPTHHTPTTDALDSNAQPAHPAYDFRDSWEGAYYDHTNTVHYEQSYHHSSYIDPPSSPSPPTTPPMPPLQENAPAMPQRGRKRGHVPLVATTSPSSLVSNRVPPARSPSPPTRVVKSTYGGNLFTAEDIMYLKKYIDYCQEQGLVLSLREICERVAIKAPHHTFYSWRRYCNKHQIKLGGYLMNRHDNNMDLPDGEVDQLIDDEEESMQAGPGPGPGTMNAALAMEMSLERNRSPSPPRALYRSTTGKGVAFTDEDVSFLIQFMNYRKMQNNGRIDMVAFWKDVSRKAPHHSRASWMKFWRRHKHELTRENDDEPLPQPPDKKMRYSREDDVLLAKFIATKPEGTSDKVFQTFARIHPHHPWKGWQEHHRIHKIKIDHLVDRLLNGEYIDDSEF